MTHAAPQARGPEFERAGISVVGMEDIQFFIVHFAIIFLTSRIHNGPTQISAATLRFLQCGSANFEIRKFQSRKRMNGGLTARTPG
jgi:hypothetical protein